jgi:23S rRNA (cytosine1962-C5)-methyltransferase
MLIPLLDQALASRHPWLDSDHQTAFRLLNGFSEGAPGLAFDIYGHTLVIHDHTPDPTSTQPLLREAVKHLRHSLNWLRAGILKTRNAQTTNEKNGTLFFGEQPDSRMREHGIHYALNLTVNQDASFYLDTRTLRRWLIDHMRGRSVLNTFAYTGSLGVAAAAGGAARVVQTDLNRQFLALAKDSYSLNGFPIHKKDFIAQDFFPVIARLKGEGQRFDCVILDPPFFSTTARGRVDQEQDSARIINKVRPLINDGGWLIAINNALYVSGADHLRTLEALCRDGYLEIAELIPVPEDCTGYNLTIPPITDPAPFNHSTKIAILKVRRKA